MSEMSSHPRKQPAEKIRRWKRTAAAALLLLVGGAIVNVAVAWGCVLRMNSFAFHFFLVLESPEREFWERRFPSVEMGARQAPELLHRQQTERGFDVTVLKSHVRSMHHAPSFLIAETVAGLPFRSVRSLQWQNQETGEMIAAGSIRVPSSNGPPRHLPFQPIFPGFIINTLFYALLLWLLFFAPFTARRMLRRRRGLCETCAYPIGVSPVCTECGAAVRRS